MIFLMHYRRMLKECYQMVEPQNDTMANLTKNKLDANAKLMITALAPHAMHQHIQKYLLHYRKMHECSLLQ